eukprot:2025857-Prymnesium_polylepis.1
MAQVVHHAEAVIAHTRTRDTDEGCDRRGVSKRDLGGIGMNTPARSAQAVRALVSPRVMIREIWKVNRPARDS